MKSSSLRSVFAGALAAGLFITWVGSGTAGAAEDKKVLRAFKAKCASCHGEDGKAATEQGKKMGVRDWTNPAFWKDVTDDSIKTTILKGVKQEKGGKKQEMEPFEAELKPDVIDALVAYVKTFKK